MHVMKNLDRWLARVERWGVTFCFAALLLLMSANIIVRNAGGYVPQKVLEFVPHCVMWIALFGSTLAFREQRHIAFHAAKRFFPASINRVAGILSAAFGAGIMLLLLFASFAFVRQEIDLFGVSGWMTTIFPVFFAISAFRCFLAIGTPKVHSDRIDEISG